MKQALKHEKQLPQLIKKFVGSIHLINQDGKTNMDDNIYNLLKNEQSIINSIQRSNMFQTALNLTNYPNKTKKISLLRFMGALLVLSTFMLGADARVNKDHCMKFNDNDIKTLKIFINALSEQNRDNILLEFQTMTNVDGKVINVLKNEKDKQTITKKIILNSEALSKNNEKYTKDVIRHEKDHFFQKLIILLV